MRAALIDTDVLSEALKGRHAGIAAHLTSYLREHGQLTFSAITLYEIERGLLAKNATRLLTRFEAIVRDSRICAVDLPVLRRAARLWAAARARGESPGDADLLIAATAIEAGLVLVTGNRRHFETVEGLSLASWE